MQSDLRVGLLIERTRAFGRELCEGIITYAQDRAIELRFLRPKDLSRRFLAEFDGFIARVTDETLADRLGSTGKPVVDVYYQRPHDGFTIVKTRHESVGHLAAQHFLDRRFRNFAYSPYGGGRTSLYCRLAYTRWLKNAGHTVDVYEGSPEPNYAFDHKVIIDEDLSPPPDGRKLVRWLRKLPKPVAVFCPSDLCAWQLIGLCHDAGLRVPQDVAVLGLDNDLLLCGSARPMLSSIDPNTREIGRVAIEELVCEVREGRPVTPRILQVEPTGVVTRASTEIYPLNPPWLSDALVYIQRNARNGISAQDIFAQLGKSHTAVSRAFRQVLDTTVQNEIARTRLAEAQRLLKTTALSVTEIAKRTGFASTTYFLQSFAARHHVSPGVWRVSVRSPR